MDYPDSTSVTRLEFVDPTEEVLKIDKVRSQMFKEIETQLAALSDDVSQGLIDSLREIFAVNSWDKRIQSLPADKKRTVQQYYKDMSQEWKTSSRVGGLEDHLFMTAVGIMETQVSEMRRWSEQGRRKMRLKTITVCAKCMDDQDPEHRCLTPEGLLTQEWTRRRRDAYRGGEGHDGRNHLWRSAGPAIKKMTEFFRERSIK